MKQVLFLPFSVSRKISREEGPLPPRVASRQIPRLLAELVDGQGGWTAQFFPFVGNEGGRRAWTTFQDLLPPEHLGRLVPPLTRPEIVIDGLLTGEALELRVTRFSTLEGVPAGSLPVDLRNPATLLDRLTLEVWDILDIPGRPLRPPVLPGPALRNFLLGRDESLALSANLTPGETVNPFYPFLEALKEAPDCPHLLEEILSMASLWLERGREDGDLMAWVLVEAASLGNPGEDWLRAALYLSRDAGDPEVTEILARALFYRNPSDSKLCLALARKATLGGELSRALMIVGEGLDGLGEEDSGKAEAALLLLLRHDLCHDLGRLAEAEEAMRSLGGLSAVPEDCVLPLARWHLRSGRRREALGVCDRALSGGSTLPSILCEKGRILILEGRPGEAAEPLELAKRRGGDVGREARRLERFLPDPGLLGQLQKVEELLKEGRTKPALKLCRKVCRRRPDLPEARYLLGMVRSSLGQGRRALAAFAEAVRLEPDFPEARNRLGIQLVARGRHQEGYEHLAEVLEVHSDRMAPLLHMAQACFYLKRFEEGLRHLGRAEALFPGDPAVEETRKTFYPHDPAQEGQGAEGRKE